MYLIHVHTYIRRLLQVEPNRPRYRGVGLDGSFPVKQGSELQCATHHPGGAAHESSTSGYFHPRILHPSSWVTASLKSWRRRGNGENRTVYSIYMDVDFEWFERILSKLPNSKLSYWFSKWSAHQTLCNLSILNLSWFGSWSFLMGSLSQTFENDTWNLNSGIAVARNSFFRCENYQLEQGSSLFLIFWNAQVSGLTSSRQSCLARWCFFQLHGFARPKSTIFLGSFESFSITSQFEAMWLENIANVGRSDLRKFLCRFAVTVFILFFSSNLPAQR